MIGLLSVAGVWAALTLPSAICPEMNFSRITVVAEGSTLGARQVVFSITRPIEEAVSVVPGVTRVRSHTIRGATEIAITFAPGTDMAYSLQLVRARVGQVSGALPAGLDIEIERLAPSLFPILSYNLEGGDPATLYDLARYEIKPLISRVPGVGRVDVQGSDVREIEVVADPARLAGLGMTYTELANAIRQAVTVQAALVRDAVRSVRDAMLVGAALAVLVLLLFLRHGRITAISAAAIPLTLAVTVFVMSLIGQTFNLMTLGAMAIAIGLVIDDAVV